MISFSQTDYYYYKGEKVFLTKNYQYVNIVTSNTFDENLINAGVQEFSMSTEKEMRNGEYKKHAQLEFSTTITNQTEYNQKINDLKSITNVEGVYPYYLYNGNDIGANNFFVVKLKQPTDITLLQNVASQKNVDIIRQRTYLPLWYVLSTNTNTTENSVELSAYFYETGYFDAVEPAFTGAFTIEPIVENNSSNPAALETCYSEEEGDFDNFQWGLFNNEAFPLADINICGAWDLGVFGQDIIVAVVDTGIGAELEDLPSNYPNNVIDSSGLPFTNNYYYNDSGKGYHGTAVASIIGAIHNGEGMGGIAPEADMLYVANKLLSNFDYTEIGDGIDEAVARQADVFNMSFGNSGVPTEYLEDALDNALDSGRGGLGAVLVAATGNDGHPNVLQPANYSRVLAVGGSNWEGEYGNWNYGDEIDLVAPSTGIVSLALDGSVGLSSYGSSYAAPHVAGIAALMISANDGIVGEAVSNILRRTAQKSGDGQIINGTSIFYDDFADFSIGPWNQYMGYGIPDATEAVLVAQDFETDSENGAYKLDLHVRNSTKDYGKEPDNVTKTANYVLWNSPDIWVKKDFSNGYYDTNDPVLSNTEVTVIVRVVNKSNRTLQNGEAKVKLYWSKFGGNTSNWPNHWNGVEGEFNCNDILMPYGDIIGDENGINTGKIRPGEQALVEFEWQVPDVAEYCGIYTGPTQNTFSFLAVIDSSLDPLPVNAQTNNVWVNTKNSNNIAWKNIEILSFTANGLKEGTITVINNSTETKEYSLEFVVDDNPVGNVIFEEAEVKIQMDSDLFQDWTTKGSIKNNFVVTNQEFKVTEDDAVIDHISLEAGEIRTLPITFNFLAAEVSNKKEFTYHYAQRDKVTGDIVYGKTFYIKKGETTPFDADAGDDKEIDKNQSVTLSATTIDDPATYNWYDPDGNLIYTGQDFTLSPEYTKQYTLEIIKDADGLKDYDTVTVEVNPFVFGVLSPNPASNQVTIDYIAEDASSAYFIFTAQSTGNTYNHIIDTQAAQKSIDVSTYPTGIYIVSLVCDGNLIESKQLIIN